jgi:aromatic-amino-acid transaminase
MFDQMPEPAVDAIFGLAEAFRRDERDAKTNLIVGVYRDGHGKTPTLRCVRAAEAALLEQDAPKTYLPIEGPALYGEQVRALLLSDAAGIVSDGRAVTAQTPGGTGALRVAGELVARHAPEGARLWLSDPTWANHAKIFAAAGVATATYRHLDRERYAHDLEGMLGDLAEARAGDVVLVHGACHNPTGVDPTAEGWARIASLCAERGLLPLVDLAYQGFGDGIDEDVAGVRVLAAAVPEMMIASSFSKTFGLYNERVGALTLIARDRDSAARAQGHMKSAIRANYSNPPRHGGAIVSHVLGDSALRADWQSDVANMRERIRAMREGLVSGLREAGVDRDFSFLTKQRGMFSFSGLTGEQMDRLRDEHGVYGVRSGRINVAGLTPDNLPQVCAAVAAVLR